MPADKKFLERVQARREAERVQQLHQTSFVTRCTLCGNRFREDAKRSDDAGNLCTDCARSERRAAKRAEARAQAGSDGRGGDAE